MKVLVTGGTGFIGRNLVEKLTSLGHHVLCLVRDIDKASWMGEHELIFPVQGDITNPGELDKILPGVEIIFHLAGLTKALGRRDYLRVNGEGTGNIAKAAASTGKSLRKIVYVSSLAVAGPHGSIDPAKESEEPSPITFYGESKLAGERLLMEICKDVPWLIVRPPVVYGPYERDLFTYFRLAEAGVVPLISRSTMELSLIHVDDLTEGLILSAMSDRAVNQTYYISDGEVYTVSRIIDMMLDAAGGGRKIHLPALAGKVLGYLGDFAGLLTGKARLVNSQKVIEATQHGWVCSTGKIEDELGYVPGISIEDGISGTLAWYRGAGWV